jgi:hypothetical protein
MEQRRVFFMLLAGVLVALAAGVLVTNLSSAGYIIGGATKSIPNIAFHLNEGNPPKLVGEMFILDGVCFFWNSSMSKPNNLGKAIVNRYPDGTISIWCGPYNIFSIPGGKIYLWGYHDIVGRAEPFAFT